MRHAKPQKRHVSHRPPVSTKTVRKVPMATPVKKERPKTFSLGGGKDFLKRLFQIIKGRLLFFVIVMVAISLIIIVFFTSALMITSVVYNFKDEAQDCTSQEAIKAQYFPKSAKLWEHFFYDRAKLKKKYPCLDSVSFGWNPFRFNTLVVTVESAKPVAEVTLIRIDELNQGGGSDRYFISTSLSEETRYLTRDGNFISLVATPSVPKYRYRILKNQKIEDIHFSQNEIKMLLQLHSYFEKEFGSVTIPDIAQDGSVRISTPVLEEIYVTLHDDLAMQLGSLQAILRTSTIDKKKIRLIDLRFGNPVIHFR